MRSSLFLDEAVCVLMSQAKLLRSSCSGAKKKDMDIDRKIKCDYGHAHDGSVCDFSPILPYPPKKEKKRKCLA